MIASLFLILTRLTQLLFLIPMLGMLSYLIHGYVQDNVLTPSFILVIFIVTVLASVWAAGTLLFYAVAKRAGWFLALVDFGIFVGFIASVAVLRGITGLSCSNVSTTGYWALREVPFIYQLDKVCGLLKASFAFAIIEILLFFWSFLLALFVERGHRKESGTRRETTYSRRSHSHHGDRGSREYRSSYYGPNTGSRAGSRAGSRSGSRAGSRAPSRTRSNSGGNRAYYSQRNSYV